MISPTREAAADTATTDFIWMLCELSVGDSYCVGCEDTSDLSSHRKETAATFLVGNHRHGRDCSTGLSYTLYLLLDEVKQACMN